MDWDHRANYNGRKKYIGQYVPRSLSTNYILLSSEVDHTGVIDMDELYSEVTEKYSDLYHGNKKRRIFNKFLKRYNYPFFIHIY